MSLLGRDLGLTLTIPAGFPAVDVNSLRYKDMIQDLVLVGRNPAKFETKYATLLTAAQRQELRDGLAAIRAALIETASLSAIELVLGREEAVVGRVQERTLQVGNDFVQRYYSNVIDHVENAGHEFGAGLSARGQGRPDRVPRDALREGTVERLLRVVVALVLLVAVAYAALWAVRLAGFGYLLSASQEAPEPVRPDLPFAPLVDTSLADPDNPTQVFHVDLARVEQEYPLTRAQLGALGPENLVALEPGGGRPALCAADRRADPGRGLSRRPLLRARRVDGAAACRRSSAGSRGGSRPRRSSSPRAPGGRSGRASCSTGTTGCSGTSSRTSARSRASSTTRARSRRSRCRARAGCAHVMPTTDVWLLFPAKLYCGQSLLDGRRELVIIDYAYNDDLPGYQENPDALAGRNGLRVRDEIRMVRPGLYLGRAYVNKVFLLNFVLYNEEVAAAGLEAFLRGEPVAEDCWVGEQLRQAEAG